MNFAVLTERIPYTGKELRRGWVRERTGIAGDAAVAFVGPCSVSNEDLVDLDDARAGAYIKSALMAHVIVEHPGCPLSEAVLRQRLLVCILCEIVREKTRSVRRDGDDLYVSGRKLTVSIAAPSEDSSLIHLGVNIEPEGAPVPAVGLEELGLVGAVVLRTLLERYQGELRSCRHAEEKVRTVP